MAERLAPFLADTWWFALTRRWTRAECLAAARLRVEQGFDTVQLVVGVPPEVGPESPHAQSDAGSPWSLDGTINAAYLDLARERVRELNELGLRVIVYGAWGHQIAWLEPEDMTRWWLAVVRALDDLDVLWCLTGEADLWLGEESMLLPGASTTEAFASPARPPPRALRPWLRRRRRQAWTFVLQRLRAATRRPILLHSTPGRFATEQVDRPDLLAADAIQTGHNAGSRNDLWRCLCTAHAAGRTCINLEPWYEGIRNQFWAEDQLYAYWVSVLSGAPAACYGAHGLWNVGDGVFLGQWGSRTWRQALDLDTPRLIGRSHREWLAVRPPVGETDVEIDGDVLSSIARSDESRLVCFIPDVARVSAPPAGRAWLPLQGVYATDVPEAGPVVVVRP